MLLPNLFNPLPANHYEVLARFNEKYNTLLATEGYEPFVYPYNALSGFILIAYLLLPPSKSRLVHYARYAVFAIIVVASVTSIRQCRSSMVTVGYGVGLLNAWAVLWSATLIIFNDARADFKRIEEHQATSGDGSSSRLGRGTSTDVDKADGEALRRRDVNGAVKQSSSEVEQQEPIQRSTYVLQSLPESFHHRLDWVLDLVSNFRGVRWTYQISGLAPPPPHIQSSLADPKLPPPTDQSLLTRSEILRRDLPTFIICYLSLDFLKYIALKDPYFWSLPPSIPSPFPFPGATRLILSVVFVYASLLQIFLLAPLSFAALLGPERIGQHAWPWLYSSYFGPLSQVWHKGLAGLWSGWWHQLFRSAFDQAGEFAGRLTGWEKKSQRGAMLRVAVAFACSGTLHACASYTTLADTKPIRGSFAFFMLQPVGIIGQRAISGWMRKAGIRDKIPGWLRGLGNTIVVVGWCFLTGPLIANEFAATGIWLYEPVPVSLFRGLTGQGWWYWGGRWVRWYTADKWWKSGLAF